MQAGHEYSVYGGSTGSRLIVAAVLGIASAATSGAAQEFVPFLATLSQPWDLFLPSVTPLALFFGFWFLLNKWFWKTTLGRVFLSRCGADAPPCIEGQYSGEVHWMDPNASATADRRGVSPVNVRIIQTWQSLAIFFYFKDPHGGHRALSHSDMAYISVSLDPDVAILEYTYRYERTRDAPKRNGIVTEMIPGTCRLTFSRNRDFHWDAYGTYYAEHGRSGQVLLRQVD
jgi:hypothetical protein